MQFFTTVFDCNELFSEINCLRQTFGQNIQRELYFLLGLWKGVHKWTNIFYILQPSYMFTDKEHRAPFELSENLGSLTIGVESIETIVPGHDVEANKYLLLSISDKEETRGTNDNGAYSAPSYNDSLMSFATSQTRSTHSGFALDDLLVWACLQHLNLRAYLLLLLSLTQKLL